MYQVLHPTKIAGRFRNAGELVSDALVMGRPDLLPFVLKVSDEDGVKDGLNTNPLPLPEGTLVVPAPLEVESEGGELPEEEGDDLDDAEHDDEGHDEGGDKPKRKPGSKKAKAKADK